MKVFVLNKSTSLHPRSIASNSRRLGVQAPENSQSYNKYSYAFNNPLKYTDPTGYTMEEWLNTVHNPYRNVIVSNSAHSINARSGFKYGTYRYNEKTGETINTWTGKAVSKQEVLLKMQLVKTGYVSVGFSTGEMVSYNGGEPFPEVVIKPIDVYEAKLKPQFVKANVESQDGEDGGGMSFWDKIRPDSEQPAGMTIYGDADGNDGPGGGYSAKYQYKSIDMSYTYGIISVVKFAIILNKWIHPRSPYPCLLYTSPSPRD